MCDASRGGVFFSGFFVSRSWGAFASLGVWVGAGAVILGNSTLGDNCVVGPNSVVSGDYPAGTTLIGNPAR